MTMENRHGKKIKLLQAQKNRSVAHIMQIHSNTAEIEETVKYSNYTSYSPTSAEEILLNKGYKYNITTCEQWRS